MNGELKEIDEGTYNELAAAPADRFLLDKKTVTIPGRTSAVEVCDVLTTDRDLIHVKRKFSSSSLSHLFGEGYVSSELLIDSSEYRTAIRDKIGAADPDFQGLFPVDDFVASQWKVVYAIIGDWSNNADGQPASASAKLPFFSKVNLLNHTKRLRRFGFQVELARIPLQDP